MADETTPDAVERQYTDSHGQPCDLATLCRREPGWAANRIDTLLAERARHAEEVARLRDVHLDETRALDDLRLKEIASIRDQLREVEGEREEALRMVDGLRKSEKTARESMAINMRLRDEAQAENVQLKAELGSLRSLLPDVRACARFTYRAAAEGQLVPEFSSAQKILAADFLREPCPECHMVERCKMSCSRGGSKGARVSVSPREGGE